MPDHPTTPIRETVERVQEARAEMLCVMFDGNAPMVEYYGPDDPHYARAHKRCVAENEAQLDALIAAVRAEAVTALQAENDAAEAERQRIKAWGDAIETPCTCGHRYHEHALTDAGLGLECAVAGCGCKNYVAVDAHTVDLDHADETASMYTLGEDVDPYANCGLTSYEARKLSLAYRHLRAENARLREDAARTYEEWCVVYRDIALDEELWHVARHPEMRIHALKHIPGAMKLYAIRASSSRPRAEHDNNCDIFSDPTDGLGTPQCDCRAARTPTDGAPTP